MVGNFGSDILSSQLEATKIARATKAMPTIRTLTCPFVKMHNNEPITDLPLFRETHSEVRLGGFFSDHSPKLTRIEW